MGDVVGLETIDWQTILVSVLGAGGVGGSAAYLYRREFRPNGGASLVDRIERIGEKVAHLDSAVAVLDAHNQQAAQWRQDTTERLERLTERVWTLRGEPR